jgi:uncharacterized protein
MMEEILSNFVKNICNNLDESHNFDHVQKVVSNAKNIYELESLKLMKKSSDIYYKIIACAWLHDVSDHKFDPDGKNKFMMKNILLNFFSIQETDLLMAIIDRISFSKENNAIKNGKLDWDQILGEEGMFIRNIVSDADKLEAIGKIGIERCKIYGKYAYNISYKEQLQRILIHADEKLLRIKDEFIRTQTAKQMAIPLHEEMLIELEKIKIEIQNILT